MEAEDFGFREEVVWEVAEPGSRYPDGSQVTLPHYGHVILGGPDWVGVQTDGGLVVYFGNHEDACGMLNDLIPTSLLGSF